MADAIDDLTHDHGQLSALVFEVSRLARAGDDRFERSLIELRDDLFHHFAREEEALFPIVRELVPDLADEVDQLLRAHDEICGIVARMIEAAESASPVAPFLDRLESTYASHARLESATLSRAGASFDEPARLEIAKLLAGI